MKKKTIILLCILVLILLLGGLLVYQQWNNISAVIDSFRYSQEDIEKKMADDKEILQKFLEEHEKITVRDLTEEEAEALNEGTLTEEEAVQLLIGQVPDAQSGEDPAVVPQGESQTQTGSQATTAESDSGTQATRQPAGSAQTEEASSQQEEASGANSVVAQAIAKLYVQKNAYLNKLDAVEAAARERFISLSKQEQKTAKQKIISEFLPEVAAWEKECDAMVEGLLEDVRTELRNNGQSEEIADKIEESYENEKKLKKSYFINRYMD